MAPLVFVAALPLTSCPGAATLSFVHTDPLGMPLAVTDMPSDPAMTRAVWRARYEPFGKATVDENPDGNSLLYKLAVRFPGQYFDLESGYHYNFFRNYDPTTGRVLEADPIGQRGGLNVYAYAANSPTTAIDPRGLYCTYTQSSGAMRCYPVSPVNLDAPPSSESSDPYYSEMGYSGTNSGDPHNPQSVEGRNNPSADHLEDVGPISRGTWQAAGNPYYSPNTGPNTTRLEPIGGDPCAGTPRDCSSFRIHGAGPGNVDASTGCIILPPNRTRIPPGEVIFVVP